MSASEIEVPFSFLNVKYAKKYGKYNNGVLEGNWYEERVRLAEADASQTAGRAGAVVKQRRPQPCDLCCMGEQMRHRWPNHAAGSAAARIGAHRVDRLRREGLKSATNMRECLTEADSGGAANMTSKYTLDFGGVRLPKGADALKNYGNLTHFGLQDWHQCMRNTSDGRCCYSLMRESYRCHKNAALQKQRRAVPVEWSTKVHRTNLTNKDLVLRNDKQLHVSNNSSITVHNK